MYSDGKKDLRQNLINRRMEQVAAGNETAEQRISRREELADAYYTYTSKMTPVIKDYWYTRKPNKTDPYYLPINDPLGYEVTYSSRQRWDEPEIMKLIFNIIELRQEPECWALMKDIQTVLRPMEEDQIIQQFNIIKNDWEQKCQSAIGWKGIAETAIHLEFGKVIQDKKVPPKEQRPPVVSPEEVKTTSKEKKKVREEREGKTSPLTETRQVRKPNRLGVPSEEQMLKDRASALAAASSIAGNGNGSVQNKGGNGKENQRGPKVTEIRKQNGHKQPPTYQSLQEKYCENFSRKHIGGLCPCPICDYDDHVYYECPQRSVKDGMRESVDSMRVPKQGPLCAHCNLYHEPPCSIGLKQQAQLQKKWGEPVNEAEYEEQEREIIPQGPTLFCMYCGEGNGIS